VRSARLAVSPHELDGAIVRETRQRRLDILKDLRPRVLMRLLQ
jgi:hypothetical protein